MACRGGVYVVLYRRRHCILERERVSSCGIGTSCDAGISATNGVIGDGADRKIRLVVLYVVQLRKIKRISSVAPVQRGDTLLYPVQCYACDSIRILFLFLFLFLQPSLASRACSNAYLGVVLSKVIQFLM